MTTMNTAQTQVPLWQQLQATARVVSLVRQGQSTTSVLPTVDAGLRAGIQALSFSVLRQLGRAEALRKLLAPNRPGEPADALLCTALALLCAAAEDASYEAHTLVNQAVEAAKKNSATRAQAAFINACLRRFLREREALMGRAHGNPVARWNHPAWWITKLREDWPDHWDAILKAAQQSPPLVLRVNIRKTTQRDYLQLLQDAGFKAHAVGSYGISMVRSVPVSQLPNFSQGWVSVQDAAAQMAAPLLVSALVQTKRARVLDACAAPGGKTAHLLELADIDVLALDIDAGRCQRIHDNLQRLGLNASVLAADALAVKDWWDGQLFDAVLLDAPCSAAGIVRRHPDIRWLRRKSDIQTLASLQQRLMRTLWQLVRPGGAMLYSTCSVFKAEGVEQLEAFLDNNKDVRLLASPGHLLPAWADPGAMVMDNGSRDQDGFYYALLQKAVQ